MPQSIIKHTRPIHNNTFIYHPIQEAVLMELYMTNLQENKSCLIRSRFNQMCLMTFFKAAIDLQSVTDPGRAFHSVVTAILKTRSRNPQAIKLLSNKQLRINEELCSNTCQVRRSCFGKELFINMYTYTHLFIYKNIPFKNIIIKFGIDIPRPFFGMALNGFWKRPLQILPRPARFTPHHMHVRAVTERSSGRRHLEVI